MGMFDYIDFKTECPKCGEKVTGFQSKDGPCQLETLNYWEIDNFYAACDNEDCDAWIEYKRTVIIPPLQVPITHYKRTVGQE